jgi:DNA-binding Lrp family transcriptional regulator
MMPNMEQQKLQSLDKLEQSLLNDFQQGFPLSPTPFAEMAEQLGLISYRHVVP